ncbi:MAG TPA: nuclear transport factor 2 family protein [Solirubrobacteraceae bacterium]|nr:nuclear transport factor 2 family protein [Solirubrobacteraceae bacterium]
MRAALEAINGRQGASFDALLAEDAEIVPVRAALEGVSFRGPDAASQYCAAIEESWEDLRWQVEEIRDLGGQVIALGRIQGRGRDSGAGLDVRGAWVADLREGLITRFQTYSDRAEALEAVGLTE